MTTVDVNTGSRLHGVVDTTADAALERALAFIRSELSLPDGRRLGDTWNDDPWIVDHVLRPVLSQDADGLPLHRQCWIELARGHWKTGGVAAVALTEAMRGIGTEVIAVAADFDQAALLAQAISGQLRRNPTLARHFRESRYEFICRKTGSKIRIMSSDAPTFFGIGVDCRRLRIIGDEFTQWARPDLYHAAITTLPKVRDAQLIVISNAGISGSWQEAAMVTAKTEAYFHTAPGVVASWIRPEDLERVRRSVPEPVYRRFYENEWVAETGQAISAEAWDACQSVIPVLDARTPVVLAADAGISSDTFAIVAVSRWHDRKTSDQAVRATAPAGVIDFGGLRFVLPPTNGDGFGGRCVAVRAVRIWTPPAGGTIDFGEVYKWLGDFVRTHNVVEVGYDVYQLFDFMSRFRAEFGVRCKVFDQGNARAVADVGLLALIRDGRLRHDGNLELRSHVLNAQLKLSAREDSKARLIKSHPSKKIDAAVALSMAAHECLRLNLE